MVDPGMAAALGIPTATVYDWIYRSWITAQHALAGNAGSSPANAAEYGSSVSGGHGWQASTAARLVVSAPRKPDDEVIAKAFRMALITLE
jgi:hypothetical protein